MPQLSGSTVRHHLRLRHRLETIVDRLAVSDVGAGRVLRYVGVAALAAGLVAAAASVFGRLVPHMLTSTVVDLAVGAAILLLASLGAFFLARRVAQRTSNAAHAVAVLLIAGLTVGFALTLHRSLWLAQLLPFSNAVVLGNWLPLASAALAGLLYGRSMLPLWRRVIFAGLLLVMGGWSLAVELWQMPSPADGFRTEVGVYFQENENACSPCCAATLLGQVGIETDEAEMARLCLMRPEGTSMLGLYRGLKLKTRGTPWDVRIVRGRVEDLREQQRWPAILRIRLVFRTLSTRGNQPIWQPQGTQEHTVVLLGFTPSGEALIADPADVVEIRSWSPSRLQMYWCGDGLQLVPRDGRSLQLRQLAATSTVRTGT